MPGGMALPPNGAQGAGGAWGGGLFPDWFEAAAREHRWDSITAANFFRNWVASGPLGPDGEPLDLGWYWNTFLPVDPATQQPGVNYNAPQFTDNPNGHLYNGEEPGWGAADRSRQPQVPPPAHMQPQGPNDPPPPPPPPPPGGGDDQRGRVGFTMGNTPTRGLQRREGQGWGEARAALSQRGRDAAAAFRASRGGVSAPAPPTTPPVTPLPGAPPSPTTNVAPNSTRPPGTPGPWGGSPPVTPSGPTPTNTPPAPPTPTNTAPNPATTLSNQAPRNPTPPINTGKPVTTPQPNALSQANSATVRPRRPPLGSAYR